MLDRAINTRLADENARMRLDELLDSKEPDDKNGRDGKGREDGDDPGDGKQED